MNLFDIHRCLGGCSNLPGQAATDSQQGVATKLIDEAGH